MKHVLKTRFLLSLLPAVLPVMAAAQQATLLTLGVTAGSNPSTLSAPVTLTAAISPPTATGKVTFYDGTAVLGVASLDVGKATFTTRLLPSGNRPLRARYWGNREFSPSLSGVVRQTVNAKKGFGYNPAPGNPFPALSYPISGAVGDFNRDGKPDLAVLSDSGDDPPLARGITVLLNDGNGGFASTSGSPFAREIRAFTVATGDFNGDDTPDLAIPDRENNNVTIWLGDGTGGFKAEQARFQTGSLPLSIAVADFNMDGKSDLAVANYNGNTVTILLGDGAGRFQTPADISVGTQPVGLTCNDFNGDGNPDLAVASEGEETSGQEMITVLLGQGNGNFTSHSVPLQIRPYDIFSVEDLNGDGNQDLAVVNIGDDVTVLLGDGNGAFMPAQDSPFGVGDSPVSVAAGDFNGDGKPDLAIGNWDEVTLLLGRWSGDSPTRFLGLEPSSPLSVGSGPYAVVGDFDQNGRLDIATLNYWEDTVTLLLADLGLTITQTHEQAFQLHQRGSYILEVTNNRESELTGEVKVVDVLPPGLVPTGFEGIGWSCGIDRQSVTCTRSDLPAPRRPYPPIKLTVDIAPEACPSAPNRATVALNEEISQMNLENTVVSNCLTIKQVRQGKFIVGQSGTYIVAIERANGAVMPANSEVSVINVLPSGLRLTEAKGEGWSCPNDSPDLVTCTRASGNAGTLEYPPITLNVDVEREACSFAGNALAWVQVDGSDQAISTDLVEISECLETSTSLDLEESSIGPTEQNTKDLWVRSRDKDPLSLSATVPSGPFSIIGHNKCNLNPDNWCKITIGFSPKCLGTQSGTLDIKTAGGAVYTVKLTGFGEPKLVSFLGAREMVDPRKNYPIVVALDPSPDATCQQTPKIEFGFSPLAPDKTYPDNTYFDVKLDKDQSNPNSYTLYTGTVAGTITLEAKLNEAPGGLDVLGKTTLQVPVQKGMIRNLSIGKRTQSSFEMSVTGFSTPREIGDNATTQVCLSLWPAPGATLEGNTQLCGLKEDIRIWYERPISYQTGSEFTGKMTVSFSGGIDAIGGLKAIVRNRVGDSYPYCVDFKTGNELKACPP